MVVLKMVVGILFGWEEIATPKSAPAGAGQVLGLSDPG